MKVFAIIALCLAASLSADASTTCNDICTGVCSVANTACGITLLPDFMCNLASTACNQVCGIGCGGIDACDTQCYPEFETCKTNAAGNPIALAQCSINFQVCVNVCLDQYSINVVSNVVGGK